MADKKNIIVMMGGQGVGKGTFSKMLMARHEFKHIETGAILRAMPPESDIAKIIANGNLVSDEFLFDLMSSEISGSCDIILDGFPRTLSQAKWFVENYADKYNVHVLYLHVDEEIMLHRINKRIREGANRCDDASPEIVRRRLDTFHKITVPAIQWMRTAHGIKFSQVDATGDVNDNFAEITKALEK